MTKIAPLATNGETNVPVEETRWLLKTPAAVATKPFRSVALPIMVERSDEGIPEVDAEDMSQLSKEEKSIEVDMPPSSRPKNRIGRKGRVMQRHANV